MQRLLLAFCLLAAASAASLAQPIASEGYNTGYCYTQQQSFIGKCKVQDDTCRHEASNVLASCMRMVQNVNECSVCNQTCVSMFEGWEQRQKCIGACADGIPNCRKP